MPTDFFSSVDASPTVIAQTTGILRAEPSAKFVGGQPALCNVSGAYAMFVWAPAALQPDDNLFVIRPTDIPPAAPGRWVRWQGDADVPVSNTLFVDGSYPGPTEDGELTTPFRTIQAAVNATVLAPATVYQIFVAPGSYPENVTVPADREIVIQPWVVQGAAPGTTCPVILSGGGDLTWEPAGAVAPTSLVVRGMQIDDVNIDAAPPGVAAKLELSGCTVAGISDAAGPPFSDTVVLRACVVGIVTLTQAAVSVDGACQFTGAVNVGSLLDEGAAFAAGLTINAPGISASLRGTRAVGPLALVAGAEAWLDSFAARVLAAAGGLPTPTVVGADLWRGDAGYYSMQHVVRQTTVDIAANLGDEYIAVNPPPATLRTVTLPAAALFGAGAAETNGGVTRRATRHLIVRNVAEPTGGSVDFATLGADVLDGSPAAGFVLYPGESCVLIPVLQAGIWNWMPLYRYGRNYTSVESLGVSGSAAAAFAVKATMLTPSLRGIYAVRWHLIASATAAATDVESRLFNATDAVQIGSICRSDVDSTAERVVHGGVGFVIFTGAAKTLQVEWRRPSGAAVANVEDAVLEIWRVG